MALTVVLYYVIFTGINSCSDTYLRQNSSVTSVTFPLPQFFFNNELPPRLSPFQAGVAINQNLTL